MTYGITIRILRIEIPLTFLFNAIAAINPTAKAIEIVQITQIAVMYAACQNALLANNSI
jgi:hypothetical protein